MDSPSSLPRTPSSRRASTQKTLPQRTHTVGHTKLVTGAAGRDTSPLARQRARRSALRNPRVTAKSPAPPLKVRNKPRRLSDAARSRNPPIVLMPHVHLALNKRRTSSASSSASTLPPPRYTPAEDEVAFPAFPSDPSLDGLFEPPAYGDAEYDPARALDDDDDSLPRSPLADCIHGLLGRVDEPGGGIHVAEYRAVRAYTPVIECVGTACTVRVECCTALPAPALTPAPISASRSEGRGWVAHVPASVPAHRLRFALQPSEPSPPPSPRRPTVLRKLSADALFGRPLLGGRTQSSPTFERAARPRSVFGFGANCEPASPTGENKRSFLSRTLSTGGAGRTREGHRTIFGFRVPG
jgi:hypothetical protein